MTPEHLDKLEAEYRRLYGPKGHADVMKLIEALRGLLPVRDLLEVRTVALYEANREAERLRAEVALLKAMVQEER